MADDAARVKSLASFGVHRAIGAQVASVPAISPFLVPGELEKEADSFYAEANERMEQGAFIEAYRGFNSALELVPNFRDSEQLLGDAVEKGAFPVALYLFKPGDQMVLLDGIPAVYFDDTYEIEVLEACVHELIELFAPRLVLGISDEISSTGDLKRVRRVGEIVAEYNATSLAGQSALDPGGDP